MLWKGALPYSSGEDLDSSMHLWVSSSTCPTTYEPIGGAWYPYSAAVGLSRDEARVVVAQVFELVKNSLRAVNDRYHDSDDVAPPVQVVVAEGSEDVTIKVRSIRAHNIG